MSRFCSQTAAADDNSFVPKTRFCEKHYNYYAEGYKKKTNGEVDQGAGSGPIEEETRGLKMKVTEEEDDRSLGDTSDIQGGSANVGIMRKMKMLPPDEQRCGINDGGGWRCKNFRMGHGAAADDRSVPKTKYCEKHYKYYAEVYKKKKLLKKKTNADGDQGAGSSTSASLVHTIIESGSANIVAKEDHVERTQGSGELDFFKENPSFITPNKLMKMKKKDMEKKNLLPPDEQRCSQTDGSKWRCKNFKMGYGDDDSVPKSSHCEKHFNLRVKYKYYYLKESGSANIGTKSDNAETTQGDFTDFLTDFRNKLKKKEMEKKLLAPDEQRCSQANGMGWRCKNFRMGYGDDDSVPKSTHCEKHYNYNAKYYQNSLKKRSSGGESADCSATGPRKCRSSKWRRKVTEEDARSVDVTGGIQPTSSDTIEESGPANIGWKRDNIETTLGSGELDFLTDNPSLITSSKVKKKKQMEEMKLPPDEQFCCQTNGKGWRCKNIRMSCGSGDADDDSVPKTKYCDKHYNIRAKYYENLKKLLPIDEQYCCQNNGLGWRCKNFRMGHGAAINDETVQKTRYCEKHYNIRAKYYENLKKKLLHPDEQYCCKTNGKGWICKNYRMGHGAAADNDTVPKSRYCEKHYNCRLKAYQNFLKKRSGDGEAAGCRATGPIECRGLKRRRKKVMEEDKRFLDVSGSMQPVTSDDTSDTIVEQGDTGNIRRERKNVERAEDDWFVGDTLGEFEEFDGYVDSDNSVGDLMDMLGMENWNWNNDEMNWNSEADMLSSFEEDPLLLYL